MPKLTELVPFLAEQGLPKTLPGILRGLRLYRGLPTWRVAQEAHMSERTYERTEAGKRDVTPDELRKLDEIHDCNDELIMFRFGKIKFSLGKKKNRLCANTDEVS
ncbi:helix-turn-helix domain-containing protein [Sporomusa termitida]|uniref:HTH cro/C1-type domain-containing protein n=1 Tax=Sporomusa termitida TaxID=2377 RepID=A0A517DS62_9FIRM|nr:helix-turn-helix transcriptional regulator [Sporomusa termitida]QDR80202.1 hypothetical protein SPTER_15200 [Sporomusa termitida]